MLWFYCIYYKIYLIMKNYKRILFGLIITVVIFAISTTIGSEMKSKEEFSPIVFMTHLTMLVLSIVAIWGFRKYLNYKISLPGFKKIFKPVFVGLLTTIVVNILLTIITKMSGHDVEPHPLLAQMTVMQTFFFVFIFASIAEEILFRGFLLNILQPFNKRGIYVFKRKLSVAVIISAITFGLAHLILITAGVSGMFLFRIVVFTSILGLIAGYYQEKYENNAFAIIVHMAGNSMGLIGCMLMHLNA